MMSLLKNLFVIIGLLLVAGLGYYIYSSQGSLSPVSNEQDLNLEAESADLIRKIDSIKRISIDRSLFSDPRFTNLRSFATPVPVYPVGRSNPFRPAE
jgi:hypothetical protein